MRRHIIATVSAIVAAALFAVALPSTSIAAPTTDSMVEGLTPDSATLVDQSDPAGEAQSAGRTRAAARGDQELSLELFDSEGDHSVTVTLEGSATTPPQGEEAHVPVATDDSGSAIYAQRLNEHQTRVITSIDDVEDQAVFEYSFDLGDTQHLAVTDEGLPFVYDETGDTYSIVTVMGKPWAKDAKGESLATTYEVDGDRVVQTVDTSGASFPVVADPTWTVGGAKAVVPSMRGGAADVYLNKNASHDFNGSNNWVCGSVAAVAGLAVPALGVGFGVACGAQALAYSVALRHDACIVLTLKATPPFVQPNIYHKSGSYGSWCR